MKTKNHRRVSRIEVKLKSLADAIWERQQLQMSLPKPAPVAQAGVVEHLCINQHDKAR